MSRINLLPEHIYNKIAAGEVVERPASVLKELIENSLDAGASKISAAVRKGGSMMISVTDDGEGMDNDDACMCFEPHATSKIKEEKDLFAISSFGFRGEAMASIASVSRITLKTRRRESREGFEVTLNGGKMISAAPTGCAPGTSVVVRDLFFNTPARKKFMRSESTEEKHLAETVANIALAHPDVSFELSFDGRPFLVSPAASSPLPRIRDLFGKSYADSIAPVSWSEHAVGISGFIGKRSFTKPTRLEQRIFVNGRPVESQAVYRGVREGFGPMLDKGRYPPCILFISLNPSFVDVNVHPAKREVRFSSDYEITSAVRSAVAAALKADEMTVFDAAGTPLPEPDAPDAGTDAEFVSPKPFKFIPDAPKAPQTVYEPAACAPASFLDSAHVEYTPAASMPTLMKASELPGMPRAENAGESDLTLEREETNASSAAPVPEERADSGKQGVAGLRIIGVFNDTYILAEKTGGLILIDQHAAHERILFERLLKGSGGVFSQKLLLPATIELSRAELTFLEKNAQLVEKLGYEVESFGNSTVKLNAVPAALSQENAGNVFRDMVSRASDPALSNAGRLDLDAVAMCACKAAVKACDKLTPGEITALLRQLADCELPFVCPHGRPTLLNISLREIERRFGRR